MKNEKSLKRKSVQIKSQNDLKTPIDKPQIHLGFQYNNVRQVLLINILEGINFINNSFLCNKEPGISNKKTDRVFPFFYFCFLIIFI